MYMVVPNIKFNLSNKLPLQLQSSINSVTFVIYTKQLPEICKRLTLQSAYFKVKQKAMSPNLYIKYVTNIMLTFGSFQSFLRSLVFTLLLKINLIWKALVHLRPFPLVDSPHTLITSK